MKGNLMFGSLNTSRQFATTVLGLLLMASAAVAQSIKKMPHPPNPKELMNGKVTKATINKDLAKTIQCPSNVRVDGVITTNGPAAVKYRWFIYKGNGGYTPSKIETLLERTLTFQTAGSQSVSITWHADIMQGQGFKVTPTLNLEILSPNNVAGDSVHFQCQPQKPGKVTAVKLTTENLGNTTNDPCHNYLVHGVITTDGPAEVGYEWVDDPNTGRPLLTLKFLRDGNKEVWIRFAWGSPHREESVQLKVVSPNEVLSNKVKLTQICR
jgi:hypothetical protein